MTITGEPLVSVLMPVFNGASFLREAIESVLNQSFERFEFIIIDDGSTDSSCDIISQFEDDRIRFVPQKSNKGIISTLNLGLTLAKGKYLARMDADDISLPTRLEQQVEFLESNLGVGCLGTNFQFLDSPADTSWIQYYSAEDTKISLLFGCGLCHPTVMLRTSELRSHRLTYPAAYPHAEDYGFWVKVSDCTRIANLPQVLLSYRQHDRQVSKTKNVIQCRSIAEIHKQQFQRLGICPNKADMMMHHSLGGAFIPMPQLKARLEGWSQTILAQNKKLGYYHHPSLERQLQKRVLDAVCYTKIKLSKMSALRRMRWKASTFLRYKQNLT